MPFSSSAEKGDNFSANNKDEAQSHNNSAIANVEHFAASTKTSFESST
jgi:hypothetical protein